MHFNISPFKLSEIKSTQLSWFTQLKCLSAKGRVINLRMALNKISDIITALNETVLKHELLHNTKWCKFLSVRLVGLQVYYSNAFHKLVFRLPATVVADSTKFNCCILISCNLLLTHERYIKVALWHCCSEHMRYDNDSKMIRPLPQLAPTAVSFSTRVCQSGISSCARVSCSGLHFQNDGADGNGQKQKVHDQPLGEVWGTKQQTETAVRFLGISDLEASCGHLRCRL